MRWMNGKKYLEDSPEYGLALEGVFALLKKKKRLAKMYAGLNEEGWEMVAAIGNEVTASGKE